MSTAINSIKPIYLHRQYKNDVVEVENKTINRLQNVAIVALQLLAINKLHSRKISLLTGTTRSISYVKSLFYNQHKDYLKLSKELILTIIAIYALVSTIFYHPLGIVITSGQDILINLHNIIQNLSSKEYSLALENLLYLANNSIYFVLIFYGSLELIIISLISQITINFYHFIKETKEGHICESLIYVLILILRCALLNIEINMLNVKWNYTDAIKESLGKEYLEFSKDDDREKFLILSAAYDPNEGLDPNKGNFLKDLSKLNERFDVKFSIVTSVDEAKKEIQLAGETGKVTGLMIRAHGDPDGMCISHGLNHTEIEKNTISEDFFKPLDPNCIISLESCSTALYEDDSIAYDVANIANKVTYASNYHFAACDYNLTNINPLEWEFTPCSDCEPSVHTVKIIPTS